MKILLIAFLFISTFCAKANDTLTRAQVYNFNVGDTFDYSNYTYITYQYSNDKIDTTTYSRYLVTNISYSSDSTTKYIQEERLFPLPDSTITLTLSNLQGYEIILDTSLGYHCSPIVISTNSTSQFPSRPTNALFQVNCPIQNDTFIVADELGAIFHGQFGQTVLGPRAFTRYVKTLIYYAKGNEIWGTQYYNIPTSIEPLNNTHEQISLYPTINNGQFKIKISNSDGTVYQLVVYDIMGCEIKKCIFNNPLNDIEIPNMVAGMYLWKITCQGKILQLGKIIVN